MLWLGRDRIDHLVPKPLPLDHVAQSSVLEHFPVPHHPHIEEISQFGMVNSEHLKLSSLILYLSEEFFRSL